MKKSWISTFLLLTLLTTLVSCNPSSGDENITFVPGEGAEEVLPAYEISTLSFENDGVTLRGENLAQIKNVKIDNNELAILQQSESKLLLRGKKALFFTAEALLNLVISSARGDETFPIRVILSEEALAGLKGEKGDTGPTGAQGKVGLTGAAGPKGDKGEMGLPGLNGLDGKNGLEGPTGKVGATGPKGDTGLPGANGSDGADGRSGPNIFSNKNTQAFEGNSWTQINEVPIQVSQTSKYMIQSTVKILNNGGSECYGMFQAGIAINNDYVFNAWKEYAYHTTATRGQSYKNTLTFTYSGNVAAGNHNIKVFAKMNDEFSTSRCLTGVDTQVIIWDEN